MRILVSLLLAAIPLSAQTAVFPSGVVTDGQLMKAANFLQTKLTTSISPTATSFTVANASRITASMLAVIDQEVMVVCGVSGSTLTIGKSSCPNVDGRGFDGSVATSHSQDHDVSFTVSAWVHNAMAAEVKALETALGSNLSNVISATAQSPNRILAGPAAGSPATPTFRALVSADIPNNAANTSGSAGGLTGYTFSGSGTVLGTTSGSLTNGHCVSILSGNLVDAGDVCGSGSGSGTVFSVGLTLPNIFSVSGSPVTTSGTLAATLATQSANAIWAGPTTGSAATPTFRALVAADIPTNITSATSGNAATATALEANGTNCSAGSFARGVDASGNAENCTVAGTVLSVGLTLPAIFSVSGSPVTGTGTLAATLATETANFVWAGPTTGSPAAPTFRALVSADIPNNAANTSGTAGGLTGYTIPGTGTAIATTAGSLTNGHCVAVGPNNNLVDNGTACGSGSGGGTVLSVALALPNIFSVSGSPVTTTGTLTATLASQSANAIWAGPTTGSAASPAFRALVAADIPSSITSSTSGNAATATVLAANGSNCSAGSFPLGVDAAGNAEGCTAATVGTVTLVGLSLPGGVFTISGGPVTASGTLTGTFNTQAANAIFAGPATGAATTPTFRTLVLADIPTGYAYSNLSGAPTLYNQTVQSNTTPVTQRANLNFDTSFSLTDNGTNRTSVALAANITANTSGRAATATALAANGTNCSAGQYATGVDASGNAEGCTTAGGGLVLYTTDFNFSQTPGTTISPGTNSVTLTPCPLGVNGADSAHQYYVSGGSGTAETVTSIGGSCTSGAASGTLLVNASFSHSGGYTFASATNGIQEAVIYAGTGGGNRIMLPGGPLTQHGTVTLNYAGLHISGTGGGGGFGSVSTQLRPDRSSMLLFNQPNGSLGNNEHISGINFYANGFVGCTAIAITNQVTGTYDDLSFDGVNGFSCDRCSMMDIRRITSWNNSTSYFGSTIDGGFGYTDHMNIDGWEYRGTPGSLTMPVIWLERNVATTVTHLKTYGMGHLGRGIVVSNASEGVSLHDNFILQPYQGLYLARTTVGSTTSTPAWTTVTNLQVDQASSASIVVDQNVYGLFVESATLTGTEPNPVVAVTIGPNANVVKLINSWFGLSFGNAVVVFPNSTNINIAHNYIYGASPDSGIVLQPGAHNRLIIEGNQIDGTGTAIFTNGTTRNGFISLNTCQSDTFSVCNSGAQ